ncbi:hypothetical protein MPC4_80045 [Methylocella tundrae]|uniref:Uncharacterized protein n=1 Tax=Methylocella tundrae TaxID=227605 RepID=A0A8B6MBT6_METTU|nr:hypothetical protein MPC1_1670002 [Methylocella tundrae]VTZ52374.1 hypothetical protein MPC4_80045 [Methylocella tundrae]
MRAAPRALGSGACFGVSEMTKGCELKGGGRNDEGEPANHTARWPEPAIVATRMRLAALAKRLETGGRSSSALPAE